MNNDAGKMAEWSTVAGQKPEGGRISAPVACWWKRRPEKRRACFILSILGCLVLLVSITADFNGLGGAPGFGWKQISGSVVGFIIVVMGLFGLQT